MAQLPKIDWAGTLKNISLFHEKDTIEFSIVDVEDLLAYINDQKEVIENHKALKAHLTKSLDQAQCQLLAKAIETMDRASEPISRFQVYA